MIRKQDKTHVRTPAALERKYRFNKTQKAAEDAQKVAGGAQTAADEAQKAAGTAQTSASDAQKAAEKAQTAADDATNQLADKVGRNENEQVVNMVNAAGKPISAEFDQSEGDHRVHFKGGVINLSSPSVERSTGVAWESKVLLLTFRVDEHKKYGLYVYGNSLPIDPDADADDPTIGAKDRYWSPSFNGDIFIEEITE